VEEEEEISTGATCWNLDNDYFIPMSINCYSELSSCHMVFGYSLDVFSRSISSTTSDLPSYPRFAWYWPNSLGTELATSTIRAFIDIGQVGYAVDFTFPRPTSTTSYILRIDDPAYSQTYNFVVNANLVGSSTFAEPIRCDLDKCTSILDIACGIKWGLCWLLKPTTNSMAQLQSAIGALNTKFPFNVKEQISSVFSETSTSSKLSIITLPWINSDNQITSTTVLTTSTLPTLLGNGWTILNNGLIAIIVAMGIAYFALRLML
jgi:hypothetical protein